jgi:hypothetical protein
LAAKDQKSAELAVFDVYQENMQNCSVALAYPLTVTSLRSQMAARAQAERKFCE